MSQLICVALVCVVFVGNILALLIAAMVTRSVWLRGDAVAGLFYGLNRDRGH